MRKLMMVLALTLATSSIATAELQPGDVLTTKGRIVCPDLKAGLLALEESSQDVEKMSVGFLKNAPGVLYPPAGCTLEVLSGRVLRVISHRLVKTERDTYARISLVQVWTFDSTKKGEFVHKNVILTEETADRGL